MKKTHELLASDASVSFISKKACSTQLRQIQLPKHLWIFAFDYINHKNQLFILGKFHTHSSRFWERFLARKILLPVAKKPEDLANFASYFQLPGATTTSTASTAPPRTTTTSVSTAKVGSFWWEDVFHVAAVVRRMT